LFQLDTFIEATLASVTNRIERHGDEGVPAVSLRLEITAGNTLLDLIDPKIREALYKAVDGQEDLPGVDPSTPVLRCNSFEKHTLPTSYEGWTLAVDDGIDDTKPMLFGGSKVDKFSFECKQGGSIVLSMRVGTSDVDAEKLGKLAMYNGQSIWITLKAPENKAEAIDGTQEAFERDHPDATDLFAAGGPEDDERDESEGGETDAWPFDPERANTEAPPQSVTIERSQPGTRTARGRDKTKKALAEGAQS